jgi:hypothetical protein
MLFKTIPVSILEHDAKQTPLEVTLGYCPNDPWAVQLDFGISSQGLPVVWVLSRELLATGLTTPSGEGDVVIWPSAEDPNTVTYLALNGVESSCVIKMGRDDVVSFLDESLANVPFGDEDKHFDIEEELRQLLA